VHDTPTLEFLLPGAPQTRTGGYIYDQRILDALTARGWHTRVHSLDPSFPFPTDAALAHADAVLTRLDDGALVVIDGLALGAMPSIVAKHAARLTIVALVHHALAAETGLTAEQKAALAESEHSALDHVAGIIVTSEWTRDELVADGVRAERIAVVRPGTDPAPLAQGSGDAALHLLSVATLTPRKGHAVLFDALAQIRNLPWTLDCVGSATRDPETAAALARQLERLKLTKRVTLRGELDSDALDAAYANADLFVLTSYLEGYGMAHAEALARGLPIVTTAAGAVTVTVPNDAAVFVPPGERGEFARALERVLVDEEVRENLARGARRARASLPTWDAAGAQFAEALERLV